MHGVGAGFDFFLDELAGFLQVGLQVGAGGELQHQIGADVVVGARPVNDVVGEQVAVGHDDFGAGNGRELAGADADVLHAARLAGHLNKVADVKRPLKNQDDARHQVVHDALQTQANAHAERPEHDGDFAERQARGGGGQREAHQHQQQPQRHQPRAAPPRVGILVAHLAEEIADVALQLRRNVENEEEQPDVAEREHGATQRVRSREKVLEKAVDGPVRVQVGGEHHQPERARQHREQAHELRLNLVVVEGRRAARAAPAAQHLEVEGFGEQLDEHAQTDALREPENGRRAKHLCQAQPAHHVEDDGQAIEPDKQPGDGNEEAHFGQRGAQLPEQQRAHGHGQRVEAEQAPAGQQAGSGVGVGHGQPHEKSHHAQPVPEQPARPAPREHRREGHQQQQLQHRQVHGRRVQLQRRGQAEHHHQGGRHRPRPQVVERLGEHQVLLARPAVVEGHPAVEHQPNEGHVSPVVPVIGEVEVDDFAAVLAGFAGPGVGGRGGRGAGFPQRRVVEQGAGAAVAAQLVAHLVLQLHALDVAGGHLRLELLHLEKPLGQQATDALLPRQQRRIGALQGQRGGIGAGGARGRRGNSPEPRLHGGQLGVRPGEAAAPVGQLLLERHEHQLAHLQLLDVDHLALLLEGILQGLEVLDRVGQFFGQRARVEHLPHLPRNATERGVAHFEAVRVVASHGGVHGHRVFPGNERLGTGSGQEQQPQQQRKDTGFYRLCRI